MVAVPPTSIEALLEVVPEVVRVSALPMAIARAAVGATWSDPVPLDPAAPGGVEGGRRTQPRLSRDFALGPLRLESQKTPRSYSTPSTTSGFTDGDLGRESGASLLLP